MKTPKLGKLEEKRLASKAKFEKLIKEAGYEQISSYKNQRLPITVQCDKGHIYNTTGNKFFNGHRCPYCFGHKAIKPHERFAARVKEAGLIQLTEYKHNRFDVILRCKEGHEFKTKPDYFKDYCHECMKKKDKYATYFDNLVTKSNYKQLTPYINIRTKILMECPNHHQHLYNPKSFREGRRCPICSRTGYNKGTQGIIYLVRWTSTKTTNHHSILKFGITNNVYFWKRIEQQAKKTDYIPSYVDARYFINGEVPVHVENLIKKSFVTGVIEKQFFGDGYTETVSDTRRNERLIKKMIWNAKHVVN